MKSESFIFMNYEQKWEHLKKMVEIACKNNENNTQIEVSKYCEGKAVAYRFVLNWMKGIENNEVLF